MCIRDRHWCLPALPMLRCLPCLRKEPSAAGTRDRLHKSTPCPSPQAGKSTSSVNCWTRSDKQRLALPAVASQTAQNIVRPLQSDGHVPVGLLDLLCAHGARPVIRHRRGLHVSTLASFMWGGITLVIFMFGGLGITSQLQRKGLHRKDKRKGIYIVSRTFVRDRKK